MSKAQILIHRYFDAAWKQGRKGIGYSDTQLPEHKELILYLFDLEHRLAVVEKMLRECVNDYINFDNGHLTESVFKRASELLNGKIECPIKESGKGE